VRNLWTKKNEGTTAAACKTAIPGHDVLLVRLSVRDKKDKVAAAQR
jgi:hypothetical protein